MNLNPERVLSKTLNRYPPEEEREKKTPISFNVRAVRCGAGGVAACRRRIVSYSKFNVTKPLSFELVMTTHSLSRRTFLRGLGVSMALPWLESFNVWGDEVLSSPPASEAPVRLAVLFAGNGFHSKEWWAKIGRAHV